VCETEERIVQQDDHTTEEMDSTHDNTCRTITKDDIMTRVEDPKDSAGQVQSTMVKERREIAGGSETDLVKVRRRDNGTGVMENNNTVTRDDSVIMPEDSMDSTGKIQSVVVKKRRKIAAGDVDINGVKGGEIAMDEHLCSDCGYSPCVFIQEYENITAICDEHDESGYANNQMRFKLYRYMTKVLFGYLGKGQRRQLPSCVIREIHDHFPKSSDGKEYVGFHESG
jgi:hypothetical protein